MRRYDVPAGIAVILLLPFLIAGSSTQPSDALRNAPENLLPDSSSSDALTATHVIEDGEDLLYEVRWTLFKLGTVRLKSLQTSRHQGITHYTAAGFIDSYEGLPFIDLHSIIHTEMDSSFSSCNGRALEWTKNEWWGIHYRYDSTRSRCFIEETWQRDLKEAPYKRLRRDTLRITGNHVQDGLSLAYFARAHVHDTDTLSVPIIAYGKLGWMTYYFGGRRGTEQIDVHGTPIRVVEFDGWLDVEGIFGLTGEFRGWFSDDSAAVPIKAQVRVILGNVNVELVQWTRKGWTPPQ